MKQFPAHEFVEALNWLAKLRATLLGTPRFLHDAGKRTFHANQAARLFAQTSALEMIVSARQADRLRHCLETPIDVGSDPSVLSNIVRDTSNNSSRVWQQNSSAWRFIR
jgi:hypothetical protein